MDGIIAEILGPTDAARPALALLASASFKAAIVLAVASVATLGLRRASAATRHLVWSVAILAALVLPLAGAVLPAWRVAVPAPRIAPQVAGDDEASTDRGASASRASDEDASTMRRSDAAGATERPASAVVPRDAESDAAVGSANRGGSAVSADGAGPAGHGGPIVASDAAAADAGAPTVSRTDAARAATGSGTMPSPGRVVLLVWLAGALVVASAVFLGLVRVYRLARRARPVTEGRLARRVRELSARLGLREAPEVLCGGHAAMPMTWGLSRSFVLLPAEAAGWSEERLDAVLLHELAHVRRRDYPIQLAADLACAVYWYNPLAWLAARRLRVEREHACDDHVLSAGARPSTYAGELLELARSLRPARATAFAAMSMARPSQLTGRLLAVLDERRPRRVVSRRLAASIALAAAVLLAPLAVLTPTARAERTAEPILDGGSAADTDATEPLPASIPDSDRRPEPEPGPDMDPGERPATATTAATPPEPVVSSADPAPTDARSEPGAVRLPAQCWDRDPRRVGTRRNSDDDVDTITWTTDDCELEARIEGDVRFRGDLLGIASIAPGGMFRLEENDAGERRRVDVRPGPAGRLVYEWFVDGDRRPFDDEARAWFGQALSALLHWTGYAASDRVAWVLAREGVDGVLADIERVRTDFVQRRYLIELLKQADPDAAALVRIIALAGVRLDSDFELASLLIRVAEERPMTEEVRQAFIEAAHSLDSDFERRRVLSAALADDRASARNVAALVDAAQGISSDFELATLLVSVAERYPLEPDVQRAFLRAADGIGSDFERRRVLDTLLQQDGLTAESYAEILDAASRIGSDFELARLLRHAAALDLFGSPEVRRAYLAAARSIGSDFELKRVLLTLVERDDLDADLLQSTLQTAATIGSDFELASLLIAVAQRHRLEGAVREAFLRATDTIGSDFEHGRVASALMRHDRGGTR